MCAKTVLKLLLSKYAPLSVDMQTSIEADQSTVKLNDETLDIEAFTYVDNEQEIIIDESVKTERKTQENGTAK
jgi:recombination protein RecT